MTNQTLIKRVNKNIQYNVEVEVIQHENNYEINFQNWNGSNFNEPITKEQYNFLMENYEGYKTFRGKIFNNFKNLK